MRRPSRTDEPRFSQEKPSAIPPQAKRSPQDDWHRPANVTVRIGRRCRSFFRRRDFEIPPKYVIFVRTINHQYSAHGTPLFISYASKNKQLADALCHTLEQHRISCWIAPRDVLPGEPYAREIIRGIRDCQIIVLIYTNDSNASEHVLNEIDKAFNYGKVIIPFIADDTRMSDEFDYYLSRKHWLTAFPNPEQHFAKLVESIARTLKLDTTPS